MIRQIDSELFKLRSTRTFFGLVLAALGLIALIAVLASALGDYDTDDPNVGRNAMQIGMLVQTFVLVIGVLAVSTEFRHGTITPTLLYAPSRAQVVVAKVIAHLIAGFVLGVVALALCALIVEGILSGRDVETGMEVSDYAGVVLGGGVAAGLYAVLGVGLGALVRNQVAGVFTVIGWTFVVEPLLGGLVSESFEKWGVNGVANGLATVAESRPDQVPAGLVLAGYAALFVVLGYGMLRGRDVSA